MPVYRALVEYDGAGFSGWQTQPDARTVQGEIERALALISRAPVRISAAGRTDAGVHARGQVVSFHRDVEIDLRRTRTGIEGICGPEVRVHLLERAPDSFHARHSALWREYLYRLRVEPSALERGRAWVAPGRFTLPRLREASGPLCGRRDFTALANRSEDEVDPVCHVLAAEWDVDRDDFVFTIRADHFLYNMVRTAVGTILRAALDHGGGPAEVEEILGGLNRRRAAPPAPAGGLSLEAVRYDPAWPPFREDRG